MEYFRTTVTSNFKMKFSLLIFYSITALYLFTENVQSLKMECIKGGNLATGNHLYTYHASVHRDKLYQCGGGLVDQQAVVGNARCVVNIITNKYYPGQYTVVVGALNVSDTTEPRLEDEVKRIYTHVGFYPNPRVPNDTFHYDKDIVVYKLKTGFPLGGPHRLFSLLTTGHFTSVNQVLIVTGNGYNDVLILSDPATMKYEEIGMNGGPLRYAETQVIEDRNCLHSYRYFRSSVHICARMIQRYRGHPEGVCLGDSGGPLVNGNIVLAGILIDGPVACNEMVEPAVYLSTAFFSRFILDAVSGRKNFQMRVSVWKKKSLFHSSYEYVNQ